MLTTTKRESWTPKEREARAMIFLCGGVLANVISKEPAHVLKICGAADTAITTLRRELEDAGHAKAADEMRIKILTEDNAKLRAELARLKGAK